MQIDTVLFIQRVLNDLRSTWGLNSGSYCGPTTSTADSSSGQAHFSEQAEYLAGSSSRLLHTHCHHGRSLVFSCCSSGAFCLSTGLGSVHNAALLFDRDACKGMIQYEGNSPRQYELTSLASKDISVEATAGCHASCYVSISVLAPFSVSRRSLRGVYQCIVSTKSTNSGVA